jgi:hypothetical protein
MAQSVFVVNRPGWAKAFQTQHGTLGSWTKSKTGQVERQIEVEVPRPGGIPHNRTGINYATGEMASTIRSRMVISSKTPEGRVTVGTKQAKFVIHGTAPHPIYPKKPGGYLRFFWHKMGKTVMLRHVNHPGTAANNFMMRGLKRSMR